MTKALEVTELTKRFGDFTAVDRVTLSVERGEIFGFLGPNGAGKTTLLKMLTGLHVPTSGDARVAGLHVHEDRHEIRYEIGYMSQLFSLYGDLSVRENIDLFAGLYGVAGERKKERAAWVVRMAGLEGREDSMTADLPLGWKQRLALGCAVLHSPSVIFLDEPTSGVDPIARRSFWNLIDSLSDAGATVLVSTHYMEEAEYCHRLALMNRGKLIALDSPNRLKQMMTEPVLVFDTDEPALAVELALGHDAVADAAMFGRSIHVVAADKRRLVEQLPGHLDRGGVACRELRDISPSLEDLFVSLVRAEGGAAAG